MRRDLSERFSLMEQTDSPRLLARVVFPHHGDVVMLSSGGCRARVSVWWWSCLDRQRCVHLSRGAGILRKSGIGSSWHGSSPKRQI